MLVDNKVHVASLVAVFMALGVGIVIGSLLVGENMAGNLVSQQEKIVQRLEREYQDLKNEVNLAREELANAQEINEIYKSYALEFLPRVIQSSLRGERIAVIFSWSAPSPDLFLDNLRIAEAQVVSILTFEESLYRLQDQQAAELMAYFPRSGGEKQARREYVQQLARVFSGEESSYVAAVGALKLSTSEGQPGKVSSAVIINSPAPPELLGVVDDTMTLLARALQEKGIKTYETGREYSASRGIRQAIDNIPGQVALIKAIAGEIQQRTGN